MTVVWIQDQCGKKRNKQKKKLRCENYFSVQFIFQQSPPHAHKAPSPAVTGPRDCVGFLSRAIVSQMSSFLLLQCVLVMCGVCALCLSVNLRSVRVEVTKWVWNLTWLETSLLSDLAWEGSQNKFQLNHTQVFSFDPVETLWRGSVQCYERPQNLGSWLSLFANDVKLHLNIHLKGKSTCCGLKKKQ